MTEFELQPLKKGFGFGGIFPDQFSLLNITDEHERWMSLALLEGMKGAGWASPNPSVGCVVVQNGKMIAQGHTQKYGGKHAERMAFESLGSFSDVTVYITLEPCTHTGHQPPCIDLLLHPNVKTVVIACQDPDTRVSGKGIQLLKDSGKEVILNVLKNEAMAWHLPFLKKKKSNQPLWIAKWAENENGYLADADGNSKWITNPKSRAHTHWLRHKYDVILVGAGTWLQDRPQLNVRDCPQVEPRHPVILIHDPKNKISKSDVQLIENKTTRLYSGLTTHQLIDTIEKEDFGFELQSVFCEGGAYTLNQLFEEGRIDLVHQFIGNKFFAQTLEMDKIKEFVSHDESFQKWKLLANHCFNNDLLREWLNCS